MLDYVFVFFLPGAAGNFFSRCLNIIDHDWYCHVSRSNPNLDISINQRYELFSYQQSYNTNNWTKFESIIDPYYTFFPHHALPEGSVSVSYLHPDYAELNKGIVGVDDREWIFYIDPEQEMEWCLLNSLYKNSYVDIKWLRAGQQMLADPNIIKLSLSNIITSADSLLIEVKKISAALGRKITSENLQLIRQLWYQWHATTLKHKDFTKFKQELGIDY